MALLNTSDSVFLNTLDIAKTIVDSDYYAECMQRINQIEAQEISYANNEKNKGRHFISNNATRRLAGMRTSTEKRNFHKYYGNTLKTVDTELAEILNRLDTIKKQIDPETRRDTYISQIERAKTEITESFGRYKADPARFNQLKECLTTNPDMRFEIAQRDMTFGYVLKKAYENIEIIRQNENWIKLHDTQAEATNVVNYDWLIENQAMCAEEMMVDEYDIMDEDYSPAM